MIPKKPNRRLPSDASVARLTGTLGGNWPNRFALIHMVEIRNRQMTDRRAVENSAALSTAAASYRVTAPPLAR